MIGWAGDGTGLTVDVLAEVLANLVCVGTPILVALAVYYARGRRQLRRFFGITERRATAVQIRLSNLHVRPAGTLSPLRIGTGFVGPAIIAAEYRHAIELVGAIQSRPLASAFYQLAEPLGLKAIDPPVLCRVDRSLDYVHPDAIADPAAHRPVDFARDDELVARTLRVLGQHSSFVLVGGPVYNLLTYYVLTHCGDQSRVEFVESPDEPGHMGSAVKIKNFYHSGADQVFARSVIDLDDGQRIYEEYFVLQKIVDWNHTGTTIFICAGNSTAATAAALTRLTGWRGLAEEFGLDSFTTVYALRTPDRELATGEVAVALGRATRVWPPEI